MPPDPPRERFNPDSLAAYFKALGHEKRVRLLNFLTEPRQLEEIASELGVARQTAHEHLQQLLETGLIERVEGKNESRAVLKFATVQHQLFHLYELVGEMGQLDTHIEERVGMRASTIADAPERERERERDLPRLTIVHGLRVGLTKVLSGDGPWLIGRDAHAALCLDYDPYVSTRHAEVRRSAGGFTLADLYASNGTWIDWRLVQRGGLERLENGALVRVGRTLVTFRRPEAK